MEWRDTGFVLATRRHGESALIVELLTKEHGRHAGLVRGGQSPRRRAVLQPGNSVAASWRGRLPQHLGALDCELITGLGFGLDLGSCAATGASDDLAYVSPRTGRAVSRAAGMPYHDKLLPLPGFLWREVTGSRAEIVAGLALTQYFLLHHVLAPHGGKLPEARERLAERMRRSATAGIVDG